MEKIDLYSNVKTIITDSINEGIDKALSFLESEQSKINKAFFEALEMDQRDKFIQSLANQGIDSKRRQKIMGKSQATDNRHLNGLNSK